MPNHRYTSPAKIERRYFSQMDRSAAMIAFQLIYCWDDAGYHGFRDCGWNYLPALRRVK